MAGKILFACWIIATIAFMFSCAGPGRGGKEFSGTRGEVKIMTLDPGHFHAALVQKIMYDAISPLVHVYAPEGPDAQDHLRRIQGFNERKENPTRWETKTYLGQDFLDRMLESRPGNVVVISGNNRKKAEYIKACVEAGLNVLSDKPMCIDARGERLLEEAFALATEKGVLLYDIMTERSEITTILQCELARDAKVFGDLLKGTLDEPSVVKESVHHFFKYVAGNPIKRPEWFCDTTQQGEGIVDVTTHLVDLVMWGCFPEEILDFHQDVVVKKARRWPTLIDQAQYEKVTRLEDFPPFLKKDLNPEGIYPCYANGEIVFALKGVHAKVTVMWNFQAPEGTGDTHFSMMRGSKASVIIRQGKEENYKPELYVEAAPGPEGKNIGPALERAIAKLQSSYPGVALEEQKGRWHIQIPDAYRIGHEAHFGQVTERYLDYLKEGRLPVWEVPNMITKYRITSSALEMAAASASTTLIPSSPPKEAVMLFNGEDFGHWTSLEGKAVTWKREGDAMEVVPGSGSIVTKQQFQDFRLHMEFNVPPLPKPAEGAGRGNRGNSGVYLQRRYEVQILDSHGIDGLEPFDCGALYNARIPDRNVCKEPGAWQAFDIRFRAARFEGEGAACKKTENARITVMQNGVVIHDDVELLNKTGLGRSEGPDAGPILLQDHGNPVKFRNIWIVPVL